MHRLPVRQERSRLEPIMHTADTNAYVVAVDHRRIGVASRRRPVSLIAADPAFSTLDSSSFHHLAQLERAAERLARTVNGPASNASDPAARTH